MSPAIPPPMIAIRNGGPWDTRVSWDDQADGQLEDDAVDGGEYDMDILQV